MNLGKSFPVGVIAERIISPSPNLLRQTSDGGWIVTYKDAPEVIFLDAELRELQRLDLQAQSWDYCTTEVALSRNGQWLAVSSQSELRIADRQGHVHHWLLHEGWDSFCGSSCFFDSQDRLWYVRPGDEYRVTVVDPQSGAAIIDQVIEGDLGHYELNPLPTGDGVLIDLSCGQDGIFLYLAQLTGEGLTIQEYPFNDRSFSGGFSPDGSEFVTMAHYGEDIRVHAFPGGEVLATLDSETIFAADDLISISQLGDQIDFQALYLGAERLIANTRYGRILLIDRQTMGLLGTIQPPGHKLRGYDQRGKETSDPAIISAYTSGLETLYPVGPGRILATFDIGDTDDTLLQILDFSSFLSRTERS